MSNSQNQKNSLLLFFIIILATIFSSFYILNKRFNTENLVQPEYTLNLSANNTYYYHKIPSSDTDGIVPDLNVETNYDILTEYNNITVSNQNYCKNVYKINATSVNSYVCAFSSALFEMHYDEYELIKNFTYLIGSNGYVDISIAHYLATDRFFIFSNGIVERYLEEELVESKSSFYHLGKSELVHIEIGYFASNPLHYKIAITRCIENLYDMYSYDYGEIEPFEADVSTDISILIASYSNLTQNYYYRSNYGLNSINSFYDNYRVYTELSTISDYVTSMNYTLCEFTFEYVTNNNSITSDLFTIHFSNNVVDFNHALTQFNREMYDDYIICEIINSTSFQTYVEIEITIKINVYYNFWVIPID